MLRFDFGIKLFVTTNEHDNVLSGQVIYILLWRIIENYNESVPNLYAEMERKFLQTGNMHKKTLRLPTTATILEWDFPRDIATFSACRH